jgi:hypothetical protein
MCRVIAFLALLTCCALVMAQPDTRVPVLPDGWDEWTPDDDMLRLYINTDERSDDTKPHIDILRKRSSWPFTMRRLGDTVFVFVAPPQSTFTGRSTLANFPDEFPLVVQAGTRRAVFRYSCRAGKIEIEAIQPVPFITTTPVKPFPSDVAHLLLPGPDYHSKTIKEVLKRLDGKAELIQLEKGFYENIWCFVSETAVRRWKLNKTASGVEQSGTLLPFRVKDPALADDVQSIIEEYRK